MDVGTIILNRNTNQRNPGKNVTVISSVYSIMMDFAQHNPELEIIGIFFGIIETTGNIKVLEAYPFRVGKHTGVQFEDEDYVKAVPLIKDCVTRGLEWLGWFHSHPFRIGDHLYMSNIDIGYQYIQQQLNPFWTALVLNPHQINSWRTVRGMRAFRMKEKRKKGSNLRIVTKQVHRLNLRITNP
jgi:proteasome lid subunit RPN8/RPN11